MPVGPNQLSTAAATARDRRLRPVAPKVKPPSHESGTDTRIGPRTVSANSPPIRLLNRVHLLVPDQVTGALNVSAQTVTGREKLGHDGRDALAED
jgi:hypothetical protein